MDIFRRLMWRFCNDGEGEGSGSGDGDGSGDAGATGTAGEGGDQGTGSGVLSGGEGTGDTTEWFLAPGVKGEGDRPEYLNERYKSALDQAKAHSELESKSGQFGKFFGAPAEGEDYALNLPEGVDKEASSFDAESPLLKGFLEVARKIGINQDGVDMLVGDYVKNNITEDVETVEERAARVANDLGENGPNVIADTWERLQAIPGMTKDMLDGLDDALGNANAIKALGFLLESEIKLPGNLGEGAEAITRESIRAAKYEVFPDGHALAGEQRYAHDAEHRKKVDAMYKRLLPGKDIQTVGVETA